MILQLYLHFPFCKRKCLYCDFVSCAAGDDEIAAYCRALESEIRAAGACFPDAQVSTVFLGGGTPSVVPAPLMKHLLRVLRESFTLRQDAEFTSEANPGTLTEAWLDALQAAGMNRLSLGVQAAQDPLLERIGRIHTFAETEQSIRLAQRAGLTNINADVMYGLPGQMEQDYLDTLRRVCGLGITHVSAYSLILEEGTPLCRMVEKGVLTVPDDDACAAMTEQGIDLLAGYGFRQYEISNYAREGCVCRHNIGYWQGEWYLGLGAAAHGMVPPTPSEARQGAVRIRTANPADVRQYITSAAKLPAERTLIPADEAMFETMMVGLRMNDGVSLARFESLHGQNLTERYGTQLESLVRDGLGQWRHDPGGKAFALTARGMLLQNEALLRLMD